MQLLWKFEFKTTDLRSNVSVTSQLLNYQFLSSISNSSTLRRLNGYDHFLDCIDLRYNEEELYIKSIRNYPKFERKNFRTFFFTQ